jgi:hypothetical protein
MRAAPFNHQNDRHYQTLVDDDLLRIARATETRVEVTARLSNAATGLAIGSQCIVREKDGEYDVLHGNMVVAQLPAEAKETLAACVQRAPSLNRVFPCRISRIGPFGGVSLQLDDGKGHES